MTARDDYPALSDFTTNARDGAADRYEAAQALDEIDRLRTALAIHEKGKYGPASRSQDERRP